MAFTRTKRQSKRRLFSQLEDFDQDIIIGNAASERQETIILNECTNYQNFTVETFNYNLATSENAVNVKTSERRFNERIDREVIIVVNTVEDRIQNAILTAIDSIVAPKIELAIRSKNPSSGRDATSVTANSDCGEHLETTSVLETHLKTIMYYICQM